MHHQRDKTAQTNNLSLLENALLLGEFWGKLAQKKNLSDVSNVEEQ